jgi:hypothetical protein
MQELVADFARFAAPLANWSPPLIEWDSGLALVALAPFAAVVALFAAAGGRAAPSAPAQGGDDAPDIVERLRIWRHDEANRAQRLRLDAEMDEFMARSQRAWEDED